MHSTSSFTSSRAPGTAHTHMIIATGVDVTSWRRPGRSTPSTPSLNPTPTHHDVARAAVLRKPAPVLRPKPRDVVDRVRDDGRAKKERQNEARDDEPGQRSRRADVAVPDRQTKKQKRG